MRKNRGRQARFWVEMDEEDYGELLDFCAEHGYETCSRGVDPYMRGQCIKWMLKVLKKLNDGVQHGSGG